ncbi:MAG: hypothetical protein GX606_06665 [Elusimicrobia bacterium]|nr:hypothetical protein [Elusimicrobiota bacterium]
MTLHMTGGLTQGVIVMDRIGDMLSERTLLAGLWPVVLETLPPDVRAQWEKGEVPVEEAVLDVRLKEGVVFLEKVSVVSADMAFDLTGDGRLSGALQGRGGLVLSDRLTQEVLKKDAVFQGICNKAQRIEIPFVLEGTLSQPQLRPDAESVAKKLLVEKGRQGLSSLLEKDPKVGGVVDILFGGDSRRETTEGSTEEGPAPSSGGSSGQADRLSEGLGVLLQKVLGQ